MSWALATVCCSIALAAPPTAATNGAQGGPVEVQLDAAGWQPLSFGEQLAGGARVRTGALGFARLDFAPGGGIRLSEDSQLLLHPEGEGGTTTVSLEKGVGRAFLASKLALVSPDGSRPLLVARGDTPVQVRLTHTAQGIEIAALVGTLGLQVSGKERALAAGQFVEVVGGEAGEPRPLIAAPVVTEPSVDARFDCAGLILRIAWAAAPAVAGYRLQLAKDPGFQQLISSLDLATPHHLFVPREHGRLVFRVAAKDRGGRWSEPSEPRPVHCESAPPEDFLRSPPDGAGVRYAQKAPPVTFSWAAAPGAPSYRFILATGKQLEATAVIKKASTEAKIEIDDLPAGDYFWGVYLEDALPYPLFVTPRRFSIHKAGKGPVTAPNTIRDWGK